MTSIQDFYDGRTLFITGVTGFMGKVLLEKLLRSCPGIKTVYVLVRPKKGQEPHDRMEDIYKSKLFGKLCSEQPAFHDKVVAVRGDILHDNLGLSDLDLAALLPEVSVVFHVAATVKFDEPLKLSVQMNVKGVQRVIAICRKMPKLEALIHVSTAYANCDRREVDEVIYPQSLQPRKLLDAVDWMPDGVIETLSPRLVNQRPNTYTYTKAMAECLLQEEAKDLPVAICRPSIVGASYAEPYAGWVDNFNGPNGLCAAVGKGLLRVMKGKHDNTADMVPVDLATNLMIAAAWYTVTERPENIIVFNGTTGQINNITWGMLGETAYKTLVKNPLESAARVPYLYLTNNWLWFKLNVLFNHYIPCWILDSFMRLSGKKPILVRIQKRIQKAVASLYFFTSNEWLFHNENVFMLHEKLSEHDRETFNFHPKRINWPTYVENYCLGIKRFALKEDMRNMPDCRKAMQRLRYISYITNFIILVIILKLLSKKGGPAMNLWTLLMNTVTSQLKKIQLFFC